MDKKVSIIITFGLLIAMFVIFADNPKINNLGQVSQNTEIRDGIQYISIDAKGGYSPKVSVAKAGTSTKLIIQTNGTYDCSASLIVRSAQFQKILPQTGATEIDLGIKKIGETVDGVCGMGMYSFLINFI